MRSRLSWFGSRVLPRGWRDLFHQIVLFTFAFLGYDLVRGLVDGHPGEYKPFGDAMKIINLERTLHIFIEPSVQAWTANFHWLMTALAWSYLNTQFAITTAVLVVIYVRYNDSFYFVRNMFLIAMGLALVGYAVFPTAPPRLMREWGFTDPVSELVAPTKGWFDYTGAGGMTNNYAAIPSMHVCFAVMIAWPMAKLVARRWAKVLWALYPLLVTFIVVATGNHFLVDVFLGAVTAVVAAGLAHRPLALAQPEKWTFRDATA
jgi:membrane-associated phospholipid phosphatase